MLRIILTFLIIVGSLVAVGQSTTKKRSKKIECAFLDDCIRIIPDEPIHPFIYQGHYIGIVDVQVTLDTFSFTLINHKITFADLTAKTNPGDRIVLRPDEKIGYLSYLDKILPALIEHLKYLKFKIVNHKDCRLSTSLILPVRLKR